MTPGDLLERALIALSVAWGLSLEQTQQRLTGDPQGLPVVCTVELDSGYLIVCCSENDWHAVRVPGYPVVTEWAEHARRAHPGRLVQTEQVDVPR
jgi:hypothetical protein